ncbi:MAG: AAA family ATPase [Candidatus Nanoarchaeia archaeon]
MVTIQKIKMRGFKSFAKPIEMFFPDGFSAIVGANGSGKSNVVDALCFVLGKSSAKGLRAEKSANLIYNGGKHADPAKEAQVDMIFNNQKKELAIKPEYGNLEEVKISRIVRQNGQSIYKINDKTVNRQEIVEMLSSASIDPEGHNIILQGDIIHFAEMRTEDRRKVIEEVAGISIYEDKKEKSLRELEKVQEKLNEAGIILTERSANLRELKKDRDQALKYKELEQKIKDHKASLIKSQIKKREERKASIENEVKDNESKISKVNEQVTQLKSEIHKLDSSIKDITVTIEDKGEIEQRELRKKIEEFKTKIARDDERLLVCKEQLTKLDQRNKQIKLDSSGTDEKISELKDKKKKTEEELKDLIQEQSRILKDLEHSKSKFSVSYETMADKAVERIVNLGDEEVYGTVGDLAEIPDKYALALEVAAGGRIKSIVVEDDFTAQRCIDVLKKEKLGTCTFLPLNKIKPKTNSMDLKNIKGKNGIVDLAINLVKYNSKFDTIFKYVFGSTLIMEDLETARRLIGQIRMVTLDGDLVETSGAMIGGYRRLGGLGKTSRNKIKNLGMNLEELEKEKYDIERKIFELSSEKKGLDLQIESLFLPENDRAQKIMKENEKEKIEFTKELDHLNDELKTARNNLKECEEQEKKFFNNFKNLSSQRSKYNDKIQEFETKIIREQEKIRNYETIINNLNITKAKTIGELEGLDKEFEEFKVEFEEGKIKILTSVSIDELTLRIREDERALRNIGNVNLRALEIYENLEKEYNELLERADKLKKEKEDVLLMIDEIEKRKIGLFMNTFNELNKNFAQIFSNLTTKGTAHLEIENPENPFEAGVEIKVKVVGNKFLDIKSLSGGEKTLTALAFIFSIQEHKPANFYLLDEVDAALDKTNSELLSRLIKKYSEKAQYIVISHNDHIITESDQLYGITMQEGISKVVSLKV